MHERLQMASLSLMANVAAAALHELSFHGLDSAGLILHIFWLGEGEPMQRFTLTNHRQALPLTKGRRSLLACPRAWDMWHADIPGTHTGRGMCQLAAI